MLSDKVYRLAVLTLATALCLSTAYFAFALVGAWAENEKLLNSETALAMQIEALAKERQFKEEYYYRLLHDRRFKERLIREKLGYVGPKELVFRFDDAQTAPDENNTSVSESTPNHPAAAKQGLQENGEKKANSAEASSSGAQSGANAVRSKPSSHEAKKTASSPEASKSKTSNPTR